MAQTLQGDRVNRFTISSTANHTDESFEGNMDVSALNSVSVLSRKKNVRIYGRNAISGAWTVLAVVGPTASTVDGTGTKYHRDTTLSTTDYDRISVVTVDGADADVRVVHSSVLPDAILSRGQSASYTTEHELTSLAAGVAQTINNVTGMPIVQVFEQTTTAAGSTALAYTGTNQSFVVPAGVTSLTAKLWGAGGASANGSDGGAGGYVTSTIPVTAGETLNITVGQGGTLGPATTFGGGGGGDTTYPQHGNAGGGLSGIFRGTPMNASQPSNALVIAGAGGSGGYSAAGGAGGGETAQDGFGSATHSGNGGTQVAGGAGGSAANGTGEAGTQFQGGSLLSGLHPGGGGGGGWFGGGCAGSSGGNHAGGGGGSSYINTAASVTGTHYAGSGITVPQTSDPDYVAGVGAPATSGHSVGNNGLVVLAYSSGPATLTDKTHSYTVTHDSSTNQLSVTSDSPMATIKVRIATA